MPWLRGAAAAIVLIAGRASADTTPPQLVNFSISPQSVDSSAGPATVNVSIVAQGASNGSISFALESGNVVYSRQGLPITAFSFPQFSPAGIYAITITLVDSASNTATFSAASLQSMGFPSTVTVTQGAFGSLTLNASTASAPASGVSGSVQVTASNSGFSWSAASDATWLTITSGASGTGNGTITWVAAANNSTAPRTGIITVAGQIFTVFQAAAGSALNTISGTLLFTYQTGGAIPPAQSLTVFSSGAQLNFTAAASSVGNWLFVSPTSGVTSTILSVFVNPVGLATGTYTGNVTVAAAASSNGSQTETVTLIVNGGSTATVTPSALSFTIQQGGANPAAQTLSVAASTSTSFTAAASSAGGWLAVSPASATTPATLSVAISASAMAQGTYAGSVVISTAAGIQTTIPVTLVVTGASGGQTIIVTPSSLSFTYVVGGSIPAAQLVALAGAPGVSFAASAASAGNWLALGSGTTGNVLSVSVSPLGLAAGVYSGAITVTAPGFAPQNVPVTLIVAATQVGLTAAPTTLVFAYQLGGPAPVSQAISLSGTNGASLGFSAVASSVGDWFSVSPLTGITPQLLTVSISPSFLATLQLQPVGLAVGTYNGVITITDLESGGTATTYPVTLSVASVGVISVNPSSAEINYQVGDPNPNAQTFSLTGPASSFTATASSAGAWLSVNPTSGVSPTTLSAHVNATGLAPGTYTGTIRILPGGAAQTITITLTVHAAQSLTVSPGSLTFTYQTGGATPARQNITVGCTASALSFRPSATASQGNWLSVSVLNSVGNNQVVVSVNPAGLAAGSYSGAVSIAGAGACNATQNVPVTLVVTSGPQSLTASTNSFAFSYQIGGGLPAAQSLTINCAVPAPFAAVGNASWLRVSPSSGNAPAILYISVDPTGLAPGSYAGSAAIVVSGSCAGNQTVSVTLAVSAAPAVTAQALTFSAGSLSFTANAGAAAPASQSITLGCAGPAAVFTATPISNGSWLVVSPVSGTAPTTITVSVNSSGLAAGSYAGSISATSTGCGSSPALPVALTVNPAQTPPAPIVTPVLTITPALIAFTYQTGAANPAAQSLALAGSAGLAFTVTAAGGWLTVNPLSGSTPATLAVSVNPAGLAAGTYSGIIIIATNAGTSGASQNISVTLTVSSAAPPAPILTPLPHITSLLNGASLRVTALAPGEIITFFGSGLGPAVSAPLRITPAGFVDSSLAGSRVIIDGTPAPILSAQDGQVTAIVPYSVAGKPAVQVQLEYQGVQSLPGSFVVMDAAPAIFTLDGSGRGQGAILDEDFSLNFDLNPADRGSIAVLYASGVGLMDPPSDDGSITGTVLAQPVAPVSVLIDGLNTEVTYAGAAPGAVAGLVQVNFRIPLQIRPGAAVGILLKVGRFTSQPGVTMAIR